MMVERTRFASIYAFKYSPRPGTPALRLARDEVPLEVADRRLQGLFQLQTRIQRALNEEMLGRELDLLAKALLEHETLSGAEIKDVLSGKKVRAKSG